MRLCVLGAVAFKGLGECCRYLTYESDLGLLSQRTHTIISVASLANNRNLQVVLSAASTSSHRITQAARQHLNAFFSDVLFNLILKFVIISLLSADHQTRDRQPNSQSEVTTLHQKNLLLLGEHRFLMTCLIGTHLNRKMMLLLRVKCRTVTPDVFRIPFSA